MDYLWQFFLAFGGTACAAILFNVPRRALLVCGLLGSAGWFVNLALAQNGSPAVASNFIAALVVSLGAEACARRMRLPVSCFAAPGIIPLVPGVSAYHAMYAFVNEHFEHGTEYAIKTLLIAVAISAGLVLAGSLYRVRSSTRAQRVSTTIRLDPVA
jgi:uncharacterized membrane protein YjjB (DUF3815 family)